MSKISKVQAREIINSRGEPTVEAKVILDNGYYGISSAPTGASISKFEAVEVRDDKEVGSTGLGVTKAVDNITQIIAPKLIGLEIEDQNKIDQTLIQLDSTDKKSKLGVNAILPVSQAAVVAAAAANQIPLWKYLNQKFFPQITPTIPTPLFNVINGGKHGAANLDFQEFLLVPVSSRPFAEALKMGIEIYVSLKRVLIARNDIYSVGDEGGFAPNLYTNAEAFEILTEAIGSTNYKLARDLFLGLDAAATNFQRDSAYVIKDKANPLSSSELIDYYKDLVKRFNLLVLEDGLGEEDWEGWKGLTLQLGKELIIVGDDLLATRPKRLETAINTQAANAVLVKPNQIGTVSETFNVINQARKSNWKVVVSHRSGETNDAFIADLSVAVAAEYAKFGAPTRGERVAKYNRLLEIYFTLAESQLLNVNEKKPRSEQEAIGKTEQGEQINPEITDEVQDKPSG